MYIKKPVFPLSRQKSSKKLPSFTKIANHLKFNCAGKLMEDFWDSVNYYLENQ
jgi:hypothetical protein